MATHEMLRTFQQRSSRLLLSGAVVGFVAEDLAPLRPIQELESLSAIVVAPIPSWALGIRTRRRYVVNVAMSKYDRSRNRWWLKREWDAALPPRPRQPKVVRKRLRPGPIGPTGKWKASGNDKEVVLECKGWSLRLDLADGGAVAVPEGDGRLYIQREVEALVPVLGADGHPILVSCGPCLPADEPVFLGVVESMVGLLIHAPVASNPFRLYAAVPSDPHQWAIRWTDEVAAAVVRALGPEGSSAIRAVKDGQLETIEIHQADRLAVLRWADGSIQRVPSGCLRVSPGDVVVAGQVVAEFAPRFVWSYNLEEQWKALQEELGPHVYWAVRESVASYAVKEGGRTYLPVEFVEGPPAVMDCRSTDALLADGRLLAAVVDYHWRNGFVHVGGMEIPARGQSRVVPNAV